jgi:hypothetical protein
MRIAGWVTKATDTDSEYGILIAFPLQQRLHERASLCHTTLLVLLLTSFAADRNYLNTAIARFFGM